MHAIGLFFGKAFHSVVVLTMVIFGFGSSTMVVPAQALSPARVQESLVKLNIHWSTSLENLDTGQWSDPINIDLLCSGFYVDTVGHVVTAGHCTNPDAVKENIIQDKLSFGGLFDVSQAKLDAAMPHYKIEDRATGQPLAITIKASQPSDGGLPDNNLVSDQLDTKYIDSTYDPKNGKDIALIQVNGLKKPTLPLYLSTDPLSVHEAITSVGYPGINGDIDSVTFTYQPGFITSLPSPKNQNLTEVNAPLWHGMSGGPTLDPMGNYIGVNNSISVSGFNFVTNINDTKSFLADNKIASARPADVVTTIHGHSLVSMVVVAGISLIIFGLLLIFTMTRRLRKDITS